MANMAALSILMVEDDPLVAEALTDALEDTGRVCVERNCGGAVAALQRQRAMRSAVPVIMMTGDVTVAERLAAQGHEVLAKPFLLHDLRLKLHAAGCMLPQNCHAAE